MYVWMTMIVLLWCPIPIAASQTLTVEDIINQIEKKLNSSGVKIPFFQQSTLKMMQIMDTAEGYLLLKVPGKMRWVYEKPEKHFIITDGTQLWIYRPDEHQVMVGKASTYFGDGKGASFLSDIRIVKSCFDVQLYGEDAYQYKLKLIPKVKKEDIVSINLLISKKTFDIQEVLTYNAYEDETRIMLKQPEYIDNLDDAQFSFTVPEGVEELQLQE